jgi:hypothetical protein
MVVATCHAKALGPLVCHICRLKSWRAEHGPSKLHDEVGGAWKSNMNLTWIGLTKERCEEFFSNDANFIDI